MKKVLALILALCMLLSLAACQVPAPAGTDAAPAAEDEAEAEAEEPAAEEEAEPAEEGEAAAESKYETHLTISMDVLDAEKTNISAKDEFFREKFNIDWELVPVTWGDWLEKIRAWVNADDMPDIVWWDMKASNTAEFKKWAAAGAFREITDDDFAKRPNLAALREKLVSDDALLSVDGHLYGWPSSRENPEFIENCYYPMFAYRRDWAKAVGMYHEDEVYTWDEVKAMIDAIKEQDPGNNGVGNTIGITMESWAWEQYQLATTNSPNPDRLGYHKDADGNYYLAELTPEFGEAVAFAESLYQDGYVWKDQINDSGSDGLQKFLAGQAFMFFGNCSPAWYNGDPLNKMVRGGIVEDDEAISPMIVLSATGDHNFYLIQSEDYWTVASIAHNVDDEKFERILDMWEWLASEEGRIFRVAGVEGKDYKVNEDGTYEILWEKDSTGAYISPYQDCAFNIYTPATLTASPNETTVEYGYKLFEPIYDYMENSGNFVAQKMPWEVMAWDGPAYSEYGYFYNDISTEISKIMVGGGDGQAQWEAFIDSMSGKLNEVLDELNANLK
jgi:ABC-type glycerol-3-phosphate transport system substrate-binding protein